MKAICQHICDCKWKFDKFDYGRFRVSKQSEHLGLGVITKGKISEGDYVMEYSGKVIYREIDVYKCLNKPPPYYMLDARSHWINATKTHGNVSRYINHSCTPNLHVEVWEVTPNRCRAFLRANRDINTSEWLSFNYNSRNFNGMSCGHQIKCMCSPQCPNFI